MLYHCLNTLQKMLSAHLKLSLGLNDEVALLNPLNNAVVSTPPNKLIISLVNMERETAAGMNFKSSTVSEGQYNKNLPVWQFNLYILFSAVFSEKQYEESLQVFSETLYFLQKNKNYTIQETNSPLAIEPVNISFNELSNLWSICGGNYFPSVLCKIRVINIDSTEISRLSKPIMSKETKHE